MPILALTIAQEDGGRSVKAVALARLGMSYGLLKRAKYKGELLLDGHSVRANALVRPGQQLVVRLPEEEAPPVTPYGLPLVVPYQDDHLLVVDKPASLASAPSRAQGTPTLENALFSYLGCPKGFVYRPVNRLDKGTSGLMAVALTSHAQHRMQQLLHTQAYLREYLAVCQGCPVPSQGEVRQPIAKGMGATIRREVCPTGKPASTHYRVLAEGAGRSLVQLCLETGRTHQIRVHMAWLGCPVVGDFLYGRELPALAGRFALHSHHLAIRHPITGEALAFTSPLPALLQGLLSP